MFLLFAGTSYYASGGANDLHSSGDDLQKLVGIAKINSGEEGFEWWHIYCLVLEKIVAGTVEQAYHADSLTKIDKTLLF